MKIKHNCPICESEGEGEIKVKKYKIRTIFNSTRCELKICKRKERRLREIVKEIDKLNEEMEILFNGSNK